MNKRQRRKLFKTNAFWRFRLEYGLSKKAASWAATQAVNGREYCQRYGFQPQEMFVNDQALFYLYGSQVGGVFVHEDKQ